METMPLSGGFLLERLWSILNLIAPLRAGEDGWSVAVTAEALDSAQIIDGRAAPENVCQSFAIPQK